MLGLFCQLKAILPNAVVATITRRSLMDALEDGIGADQILGFLTANAHPRALDRKGGAVPETVRDQIRLWEKERNRISAQKVAALLLCAHRDAFDDFLAAFC